MQKIMLSLFGHKPANKEQQPPITFKSLHPKEKPSYEDWVREFNVGMLWDRKTIHIQ